MIATIVLVLAIVAIGVVCFIGLSRDAKRIHGAIDAFLVRANEASTVNELLDIRKELVAYHNKECWHRQFGYHSREVINYIDGRLSGLKA